MRPIAWGLCGEIEGALTFLPHQELQRETVAVEGLLTITLEEGLWVGMLCCLLALGCCGQGRGPLQGGCLLPHATRCACPGWRSGAGARGGGDPVGVR